MVEECVDYSHIAPSGFGTADMVIIGHDPAATCDRWTQVISEVMCSLCSADTPGARYTAIRKAPAA